MTDILVTDIVTSVAVIGRFQLMPGILPIDFHTPDIKCLVLHSFQKNLVDSDRGIDIDVSDCTVFTVTHVGTSDVNLELVSEIQAVFERSILAISEVIIWTKAHDVVSTMSAFARQIGTSDVKAFFAQNQSDKLVGWLNPAFTFDRDISAMMSGFLSNMIVSNGPAANPIPALARRVMSSLDLINLGFYTESFINLFSLVDDLSQEVVKSGMARKGLGQEEQKHLLMAIKEERLKVFLCHLTKLCDWVNLEEAENELYKNVMKINARRNKIMHGSLRLTRMEAIEASNILLQLINWLRNNPYGFNIPNFPLLKLAEASFSLIPLKSDMPVDKGSGQADSKNQS